MAHNGEDVNIDRLLGVLNTGFYVDVGANEPLANSNTHHLYVRGWRGIDIEPNESLALRLKSHHPENTVLNCAAGREAGKLDFYCCDNHECSSFRQDVMKKVSTAYHTITAKIMPLNTLLERYLGDNELVLISIDTEGWEKEVLAGFDMKRWQPRLMVIESVFPNSTIPCYEEWEPTVIEQGYNCVLDDGFNRYYSRG